MTNQILDAFDVGDVSAYAVVRSSPSLGFEPGFAGVQLESSFSARWNGYVAQFGLEGDQLILQSIKVFLAGWPEEYLPTPGPPRILDAEAAEVSPDDALVPWVRYEPGTHLHYTGAILVGGGESVPDAPAEVGPAGWYEHVLQLDFAEGLLQSERNVSEQIEQESRDALRRREEQRQHAEEAQRPEFERLQAKMEERWRREAEERAAAAAAGPEDLTR